MLKFLKNVQKLNFYSRKTENMQILYKGIRIKKKIYENFFAKIVQSMLPFVQGFQKSCSETLNNEYIERIHQMSYSSLSDNGMLQIFSFFN